MPPGGAGCRCSAASPLSPSGGPAPAPGPCAGRGGEWRADARPVPMSGARVIAAALEERYDGVVIDVAGPATFVLEPAELRLLARPHSLAGGIGRACLLAWTLRPVRLLPVGGAPSKRSHDSHPRSARAPGLRRRPVLRQVARC